MQNSSTEKLNSWLMRCKAYWLGEWFDPHTSFLKLPSFWAPFIIILLLFSLLCWKVASDNQLVLSWSWTVQGMYEWFRIPFWVLALLIPVIGLFNANHKSEQAKESMKITREQNFFANHYKHLELFESYVQEKSAPIGYVEKCDLKTLYSIIYPSSQTRGFTPNLQVLRLAITQNINMLQQLKMYHGTGSIEHYIYQMVVISSKNLQVIREHIRFALDVGIDNSEAFDLTIEGVAENVPDDMAPLPFQEIRKIRLFRGDLKLTLLNLIEIYRVITYAYGFDPKYSGILDSSLQILKSVSSVTPERINFSPVCLVEGNVDEVKSVIQGKKQLVDDTLEYLNVTLDWLKAT